MTARRTTVAVVSEFLSDLPDAPAETRNLLGAQLLRALGLTKEAAVPDDEVDDVIGAHRVEGRCRMSAAGTRTNRSLGDTSSTEPNTIRSADACDNAGQRRRSVRQVPHERR
ncbi:hypothetical protein ACFRQM_09650 [Streptomyces sp. NPDC056831]|uniref:hypothetical protein n=1 Tax=Streptomyces sp. NPDC056831 TaxID=3345954 RepID=UPI00367CA1B6